MADVRVSVRIRPRRADLNENYEVDVVQRASDNTVVIFSSDNIRDRSKMHSFTFDTVFDESHSTEHIYYEAAVDMVDAVLQGSHATIFTYGQTGSGKTFTVLGDASSWTEMPPAADAPRWKPSPNAGLFTRILLDLFRLKHANSSKYKLELYLSIVEVYNETLRDLFAGKGDPPIQIKEDSASVVSLHPLKRHRMDSISQVQKFMETAQGARSTSSTNMNHQSSRSHAVFMIDVVSSFPATSSGPSRDRPAATEQQQQPSTIQGRLTLVDLAGSERIKRSGVEGDRLTEAQFINKSLSALGLVVNSLYMSKPHVPYRDSKLTRILRNSFAANSKIMLIANVSPSYSSMAETLSTLRFADRVKGIKSEPAIVLDYDTEQNYMNAVSQFESLVGEFMLARQAYTFSPVFLAAETRSLPTDDEVARGIEEALEAKRLQEIRRMQEREERIKREVADRLHRIAEEDQREISRLQKSIQLLTVRAQELRRLHGETALHRQRIIDPIVQKIHMARTARQESEEKKLVLEQMLAALEHDIDALEDQVRAKEQEVSAEFQANMEKMEGEDQLWKEECQHWDLERRLWDAFYKIRKARRVLAKRQKEARETSAVLEQLTLERQQKEHRWIAESILADVLRNGLVKKELDDIAHADDLVDDISDNEDGPREDELADGGRRSSKAGGLGRKASSSLSMTRTSSAAAAVSPRTPASASSSSSLSGGGGSFTSAVEQLESPTVLEEIEKKRFVTQKRIYDSDSLSEDVLRYLEYGNVMLKHGRGGQPHKRFFFLRRGTRDAIGWFDSTNVAEKNLEQARKVQSSLLEFKQVEDFVLGQYTRVFKRTPSLLYSQEFYQSLSLVYDQGRRSLDFMSDSKPEFEAWLIGLMSLLRHVKPHFGAPLEATAVVNAAKQLPESQYGSLSESDVEFCCEFHIAPAVFLTIRKTLQERRQDLLDQNLWTPENRVLTRGEMRALSGLDFFRSEKLLEFCSEQRLCIPAWQIPE